MKTRHKNRRRFDRRLQARGCARLPASQEWLSFVIPHWVSFIYSMDQFGANNLILSDEFLDKFCPINKAME